MSDIIRKKFIKQTTLFGHEVELVVHKYKPKVFHNNLWDKHPEAIKARGAVYWEDHKVVHPMDKCFNYKENGAGADLGMGTIVRYYRKYNGFMGNLTYVDGLGWILSTTGDAMILGNETQNKYLQMMEDMFEEHDAYRYYMDVLYRLNFGILENLGLKNSLTLTFEIMHQDDPHIVEEDFGIKLLCYQVNGETRPIVHSDVVGGFGTTSLGNVIKKAKNCKHEGFMVYDASGNLLFKIKSPYYLAKKWVQRGGSSRIWRDRKSVV